MKIVLTLKSDALPGGGVANKGVVDREIACDKRGLPLIPARRIKGILREAAEELEFLGLLKKDFSRRLFGESGSGQSSPFKISDGTLEDCGSYKAFLDWAAEGSQKDQLKSLFSPVSVLENFSYLRSQTSVDGGVAQENTLRISRVLKKRQRFVFRIHCQDEYIDGLEMACAAVESFGESRNRGLGEISLTLDKKAPAHAAAAKTAQAPEETGLCELPVTVEALSQLLMSGEVGDEMQSCGYIPGYAVLGAFASAYVKDTGADPASDAVFERLFLSGDTRWGTLYPSDGSGALFAPAPLSVRRYKDSPDCVNLLCGNPDTNKTMKGMGAALLSCGTGLEKFVSVSAEMNVGYHHQRAKDRGFGKALETERGGDNGVFFQFETLEREQFFSGRVVGSAQDLQLIASLLPPDGIMFLGRSKGTQYGECRLSLGEIAPCGASESPRRWAPGAMMAFRLLSDTVLVNEYGYADPRADLLRDELCRLLGLSAEEMQKISIEDAYSKKKNLAGYLGVWNLPKIQHSALAAGSVLKLKNGTGRELPMEPLFGRSAGIRTAEGCGMFCWDACDNCSGATAKIIEVTEAPRSKTVCTDKEGAADLVNSILYAALVRKLRSRASEEGRKGKNISSSAVGRFISMIKRAQDERELNDSFFKNLAQTATQARDKISKELYLASDGVNMAEFREKSETLLNELGAGSLADIGCPVNTEISFKEYKIYALAYLTELKYQNRNKAGRKAQE